MRIVLKEHGDGLAKIVECECLDIVAPEQNFAFMMVVQTRYQLQDRALS